VDVAVAAVKAVKVELLLRPRVLQQQAPRLPLPQLLPRVAEAVEVVVAAEAETPRQPGRLHVGRTASRFSAPCQGSRLAGGVRV